MSCTENDVKLDEDGYWLKCVNSDWLPLSTPPVMSGPGVGAFLTIESPEAFDNEKIQAGIADPHTQVVVVLIDKPDPNKPLAPKPDRTVRSGD